MDEEAQANIGSFWGWRGSNCELQTQLEIARALGLGDMNLLQDADTLSHEVGKMIFGVLEAIKN